MGGEDEADCDALEGPGAITIGPADDEEEGEEEEEDEEEDEEEEAWVAPRCR